MMFAVLLIDVSSTLFQLRTGSYDSYFYSGCIEFRLTAAAISSSYLRRISLILDSRKRIANALVSNLIPSNPMILLSTTIIFFNPAGSSDDALGSIFVSTTLYFCWHFPYPFLAFTTRLFGSLQALVTFAVFCIAYPLWIISSIFTENMCPLLTVLWLVIPCLALLLRKLSTLSKQLVLITPCGVPWIAICVDTMTFNSIDTVYFSMYEHSLTQKQLSPFFFATSFAFQILLFGLLFRPLCRILVDMHVEPKPE